MSLSGGALGSVRNEAFAKAQPGIVAIVWLERAVAVIAKEFWRAKRPSRRSMSSG